MRTASFRQKVRRTSEEGSSMTQPTLFDLAEPRPFAVVAVCHHCGARTERITEDQFIPKPHLLAIAALSQHMREAHPEAVAA